MNVTRYISAIGFCHFILLSDCYSSESYPLDESPVLMPTTKAPILPQNHSDVNVADPINPGVDLSQGELLRRCSSMPNLRGYSILENSSIEEESSPILFREFLTPMLGEKNLPVESDSQSLEVDLALSMSGSLHSTEYNDSSSVEGVSDSE